jgi:hypothetical protein
MDATKDSIQALADELGLFIRATFVPWSRSRNAGEKQPSLNWKVHLVRGNRFECKLCKGTGARKGEFGQDLPASDPCQHHGLGRVILEMDYMAGMGHCPSYQQSWSMTIDQSAVVRQECETGRARGGMGRKPILPKLADVLACIAGDADVLDHATFEEWASDMGCDPDSRKAEALYRHCLEQALKLRNGLGDENFRKLREGVEGY